MPFRNQNLKWPLDGMRAKLQQTLLEIEDNFEKYRISDALIRFTN
jgi:hypothetical protein